MSSDTLFYNLINNKCLNKIPINTSCNLEEVEESITMIGPEYRICFEHYSKYLSCINPYNPQNKPVRQVLFFSSPFPFTDWKIKLRETEKLA